jgi:enoyl-CoA hydratase/carnithine racemase
MMYAGGTRRGAELVGFGSRVHRVVPVGEVRPAALDLARRLAEKTPASLRLLKATLAGPRLAALARARSREDAMHQVLRADPSTPARALARFPR